MKRKPPGPGGHPLKTAELIDQLDRAIDEARQVGGDFCLVDIDAAMVMLDRADATQSAEVRSRNIHNAERAYEVVSHLLGRLVLDPEQDARIREGLRGLRARLDAHHRR